MALSDSLAVWVWLLAYDGPRGLRQRLFTFVVAGVFCQVYLAVMAFTLFLAVVSSASLSEISSSIDMWVGFYSCLGANYLFFRHRRRAWATIDALRRLSSAVEAEAQGKAKVILALLYRRNRRLTAMYLCFVSTMVGSVWTRVLITRKANARIWPMPPGEWGDLGVGIAQMVVMLTGCTGWASANIMVANLGTSLEALYRALSLRIGAMRSKADVSRCLQLHQELTAVARRVEFLFSGSLAHQLLSCFSVTLVSTLQLVHNDLHPFTFTGLPTIFVVFMPLAVASQRMADASEDVQDSAYHAAFEVETNADSLASRQALTLMIQVAGRPSRFSCSGLGPLNLRSASNALRSWYTFTNMLLSIA